MTQVWEHSQAAGSQLLVLLAIADFADDLGKAWPSVPTLAKKARITKRHAQKVIRQLKDMGELAIDQKTSGHWGTNHYHITLKPEGVAYCHGGGELEDTGGVAFDAKGGELEDTQSVKNHHRTVNKERVKGKPSPDFFSPIVEKTIRRLNELAGTSYRPNTKVTAEHINARISDGYTLEDFETVLESKWDEWKDNSDMRKFYRPKTLFSPEHFEAYLQAAKLNGNRSGQAPVIEELEGNMVKVDGVTMDRKTYELRYGRSK